MICEKQLKTVISYPVSVTTYVFCYILENKCTYVSSCNFSEHGSMDHLSFSFTYRQDCVLNPCMCICLFKLNKTMCEKNTNKNIVSSIRLPRFYQCRKNVPTNQCIYKIVPLEELQIDSTSLYMWDKHWYTIIYKISYTRWSTSLTFQVLYEFCAYRVLPRKVELHFKISNAHNNFIYG